MPFPSECLPKADRTTAWYDENAVRYAELVREKFALEQINSFLGRIPAGARILDAGCGSGRDAAIFLAKGVQVTGIDLSRGMLRIASIQAPTANFVLGTLLSTPFLAQSFDGVWAQASLHHMEDFDDVRKALQEFWRLLKPEGILHLSVRARDDFEATRLITNELSEVPRFYRFFSIDEISLLLESSKFRILNIGRESNASRNSRSEWITAVGLRQEKGSR